MKISVLKKMIHEEVRKAVRAELRDLLSENETVEKSIDTNKLNELRSKFSMLNSRTGYYDGLKSPNNKKTVINGEPYASGNGLLEWFKSTKDAVAIQQHKEVLNKNDEIDEYVNNIIGKKRI